MVEMFNDENNVDVAVEKAKEIAAAGKYMLVIGHSLSSASIAAGEIYQEAGIPAISGSATAERLTSENEWYFRVIPNSRSQSVFVANYVYRILGYDKAAIVYDVDAFGVSLADAFEDAFIELGGDIAEQFSLDRNQSDLEDRVNEIAAELAQLPDGPGIIFYATHANEGANLIVALKQQQGKVYPGVGASAFSNINFIEKFNELYEEQYIPGFFSDGIFTVAPVVFDVADVAGQMFRDDFLSTYQEEPGMKAATNYDALLVAVQAMKRAGIIGNKSDIENERKKLRDALADINSIDEAVNGVTGLVYFDEVGDIIKPATMMGVYQQGHRISALHQLMPVTNPARVIDLVNEVKEGRIIEVEDQYL
ncbi:MAG: ABC transporter substrate-binding protein, partial [Anaerolineales bacterium]